MSTTARRASRLLDAAMCGPVMMLSCIVGIAVG
jgi:hypothetical protein